MPQTDFFPGLSPGAGGPATRVAVVTPNDAAPLLFVARKLWIGTAGNVRLLPRDSLDPVTIPNVPVGELNVCTRQVFATGTTAGSILAFA